MQCKIKTSNFVSHIGVFLCDKYLRFHYMGLEYSAAVSGDTVSGA